MPHEPPTPGVIELTRRVYAALNARDFDAVVGMFGATSVWDVSRWGLGTHTGLRAIRQFLEDWFGSLEAYEVRVEEMHDLGNGVVLAVVDQLARQAGTRGALRVRSAPVFIWAESTIAVVTLYPNIDEGRAAAARAAAPSSKHNIHLHARLVDAIRAREVPDDLLAPDFQIEGRVTPATDYKYHGAAGLREWIRDLFEAFVGRAELRVEEVIVASDDVVVARFSLAGPTAGSTHPVELRWVGVTWFRDGKALRTVGYTSRDEALRAVGLAD